MPKDEEQNSSSKGSTEIGTVGGDDVRSMVAKFRKLFTLLVGNEDEDLKDIERRVADVRSHRRENERAVNRLLEELTKQADAHDRAKSEN